jgi:hypothetical protein
MILPEAYAALQRILAPLPVDPFFDEVLGKRFVKIPGGHPAGDKGARAAMLGPDPEQTILAAYHILAPHLGCHAGAPIGDPPMCYPAADMGQFRELIDAFHARRYTVRVPSVRRFAPEVDAFCRALEAVIHQPVMAEAFWSRGDGSAGVHHDDFDLIAIQLKGRKRWFIETEPSPLPNVWRGFPVSLTPVLGPNQMVEVEPGDMLYLPRGTQHRVESLSDSVHISIGFVPLTVREAIIAALDHLSDLDRGFREMAEGRLALSVRRNDFGQVVDQVREGAAHLASLSRSDAFVADALQRRSSRAVSEMDKLASPRHRPAIGADTAVRHVPNAISHLSCNADWVDFAHPGGHIYIHRGAEESVTFIADTPRFHVRDIPGAISDEVRIALANRFLAGGFLEVAG